MASIDVPSGLLLTALDRTRGRRCRPRCEWVPYRQVMRRRSWETITAPEAGQKETSSSLALFILIMLLIVALFTSYLLQSRRIQAVHETVLSIFAGTVRYTLSHRREAHCSEHRDGSRPRVTINFGYHHPKRGQLRLSVLLQPSPSPNHSRLRIRTTPSKALDWKRWSFLGWYILGKLLSKYWYHPYVRLCRDFHLDCSTRIDSLAVD